MLKIKTIKDVNLSGKRVFVRVDFNVPMDKSGEQITDKTRILATIPTIEHLLKQNAKIILASHLGKPKGQINPKFSLKPVAIELAKILGKPVLFLEDCIGQSVEKAVNSMSDGNIILLENLRFHKEEEENDSSFSKSLANLAEVYVNDAFGTAHRAHASTEGITKFIPVKLGGFLMEKELEFLGNKTNNPKKPFCVILGGAKVSSKIQVIESLLERADTMIIGGGMAFTFALAMGKKIGNSLVELDKIEVAKSILEKAKSKGVKFLLPIDRIITDKFDFDKREVGTLKTTEEDIPDNWIGVDIGPKTVELFSKTIASAGTILLNGPMGVFEIPSCAKGSFELVKSITENSSAISIVGGGDSVALVNQSGLSSKFSFMSTGGGASLEFLEGKNLPGVSVLDKN